MQWLRTKFCGMIFTTAEGMWRTIQRLPLTIESRRWTSLRNRFQLKLKMLQQSFKWSWLICSETNLLKASLTKHRSDDFYRKYVSSENLPGLRENAARLISLFGNTNICEQLFSCMKQTKSKVRSSITDGHLKQCLRLASTSIEARPPRAVVPNLFSTTPPLSSLIVLCFKPRWL